MDFIKETVTRKVIIKINVHWEHISTSNLDLSDMWRKCIENLILNE